MILSAIVFDHQVPLGPVKFERVCLVGDGWSITELDAGRVKLVRDDVCAVLDGYAYTLVYVPEEVARVEEQGSVSGDGSGPPGAAPDGDRADGGLVGGGVEAGAAAPKQAQGRKARASRVKA